MQLPHAESSRRAYNGPAIFSFGFRPFFLGGAIFAAIAIVVWLAAFHLGVTEIGANYVLSWHIHEMLFGFFAAIAAGFLLTAIPNWTGRLPVRGWGLAALFGLWLVGRVVIIIPLPLPWLVAVLDSSFLVCFAVVVWREILAVKNTRNVPVCLLVTLLAVANIAFHVFEADPDRLQMVQRATLAVPAMMIALIGGRIVPSFTRNWLAQRGETRLPAPTGAIDQLALVIAGIAFATWIIFPLGTVTGLLFVLAACAHAIRLARWRWWLTGTEALVWILHVGYGWLVLAMLLLGLSILGPQYIPVSAAVHALTAGAMGVMILAVMTRATLGHVGRERRADGWTMSIYALAITAAFLRVLGGLALSSYYLPLLLVAGAMWSAAFLLFALRYGPLLIKPQ